MKRAFRILLGLVGTWICLLGLHGLYTYTSRYTMMLELYSKQHILFFIVEIPVDVLSNQIRWMTMEGMQSIVTPAIVAGVGAWASYKLLR